MTQEQQSGPKYMPLDAVPADQLGYCTTCGVVYKAYDDDCPVCSGGAVVTQEQQRKGVAELGGAVNVEWGNGTDVFLRIDRELVLTHEDTARRLAEEIEQRLGGEE